MHNHRVPQGQRILAGPQLPMATRATVTPQMAALATVTPQVVALISLEKAVAAAP